MTARTMFSRLRDLLVHVGIVPEPVIYRRTLDSRRWTDAPCKPREPIGAMVPGNNDTEVIYRLLLESGTAETFRHA